jgi:hypothetical protein
MTLPRLYVLQRYWRIHPPVGDLVAAYLGYEAPADVGAVVGAAVGAASSRPEAAASGRYGTLEELKDLWASFGGKVT